MILTVAKNWMGDSFTRSSRKENGELIRRMDFARGEATEVKTKADKEAVEDDIGNSLAIANVREEDGRVTVNDTATEAYLNRKTARRETMDEPAPVTLGS